MTRAELATLLDGAGITGVAIEDTPHPRVVRVQIGGSLGNKARARTIIEADRNVHILNAWADRKTAALVMRVELVDGA